MKGIIGKKIRMTSLYDDEGNNIPCTVIEAGPCVVTQVRDEEKDGYRALQLGYGERKEKNTPQALIRHFEKAQTTPKARVTEFRNFDGAYKPGDVIKADVFEEGEMVDVKGVSKGKGFQGVMKRHGFSGVGMKTHGQKNQERHGGSIGASADPSRVFKGMKMPGRTGNSRTTMRNLEVLAVFPEKNLLVVSGAVPGHKGNYLLINSATQV